MSLLLSMTQKIYTEKFVLKNTGKMGKTLEKGNFVNPKKWEP